MEEIRYYFGFGLFPECEGFKMLLPSFDKRGSEVSCLNIHSKFWSGVIVSSPKDGCAMHEHQISQTASSDDHQRQLQEADYDFDTVAVERKSIVRNQRYKTFSFCSY